MTQTKIVKPEPKTILVGMTGRIDSTVAAYLLKKQGHNVIGIGILFNKIEEELEQNGKTGELIRPYGVQFINDLSRVKGVCDELDIPFYGVHAEDRYQDMVQDFIVAARLGGNTFSPLVYSTKLIINILSDKMQALEADFIATGNYAKISLHPKTGAISLSQSNDLANDETFELARIESVDAVKLILPLSEMRRKEVIKVYRSLNLSSIVSEKEVKGDKVDEILLMEDPRVEKLVEKMSSEDLRRAGSFINYMEDSIIGEHGGIHKYFVGQSKLKSKNLVNIDQKLKVVKIDAQSGDIYLCPPDELQFKFCELKEFSSGKGKDNSIPLDAFVKFRPDLNVVACDVYVGNNNSAVLEFKKVQKGQLVNGQFVVIYDREGEGARVIGAGVVNQSGYFDKQGKRRKLPVTNMEKFEDTDEEVGTEVKRAPFKF